MTLAPWMMVMKKGEQTTDEEHRADRICASCVSADMARDDLQSFMRYCVANPRVCPRWYAVMLRRALRTVRCGSAPSHDNIIINYILSKIDGPLDLPADGGDSFLHDAMAYQELRGRRGNRTKLVKLLITRGASPRHTVGGLDIFDREVANQMPRVFRPGQISRILISWKRNGLMVLARAALREMVRQHCVKLANGCPCIVIGNLVVDVFLASRSSRHFHLPKELLRFAIDNKTVSDAMERWSEKGSHDNFARIIGRWRRDGARNRGHPACTCDWNLE